MSVPAWLWTATGRAFAKWAGIAALVLAVLWKARESGRDAERVKQREQDLENLRKRNTIDDQVASTSDADLRDELARWVRVAD